MEEQPSTEHAGPGRRDEAPVATPVAASRAERFVTPIGVSVPGVPMWLEVTAGWSWRAVVIGVALFYALRWLAELSVVVLPLIVAAILATLCIPPAQRLQRRGVPAAAAAFVVVVGGLAVVTGVLAALAPSFVDQIADLRPTIDDGVDSLLQFLDDLGYDQARLDELVSQGREQLSGSASTILGGLAGGLSAALSGIAGLALLVVLLFFFVKDSDEITAWLLARTPPARRDLARALGTRAWSALSGYVRGTASIAAIDAIAIGIGLAIIGVPLVMPLALLVFLGAFLPVVGALLAGLIAVLVALAAGGLGSAIATLVLIVAVQQVEGNVLQPLIMRRAVALHPVVVLTALAIGATLAGIIGAFLSLPVAAVAAAVGNELRLRSEPDAADVDDDGSATGAADASAGPVAAGQAGGGRGAAGVVEDDDGSGRVG